MREGLVVTHAAAGRDERFVVEGRWALRVTSAIGRRRLRSMMRGGVPAFLREPFEFLLQRSISTADREAVDRIEALRARLAASAGDPVPAFGDGGTGGPAAGPREPRPDERTPHMRTPSEVAHVSSVSPLWGTFLHLCARASGATTILELGAGAGISGCYLASAPACRRFITVEGSPERAALADAHLGQIARRWELVNAPFETALDGLLPTLHEGVDFLYIDGGKARGDALGLFDRVAPRLNGGAVVVFDDIHWSVLREDWKDVCGRAGLSCAVNAGRFGVCVWEGGSVRAARFTLFQIAGLDLYRLQRDVLGRLPRPS